MRRVDALLVCCALACFGCSLPAPNPQGEEAKADAEQARVAETLPSSELPEKMPANTSISYRVDIEAEHIDELKLTPVKSAQTSARGRRHVTVYHSAPQTVLNAVYGTLREHACDQARSRVERAPSRGGTILQLRAGGVRNVINDRDKFFPEPRWSDAYKACATALDQAFPTRGARPAAQLRLEFAEKLTHDVNVSADVGPDMLGISWDKDQRVATIELATVRPLEVTLQSGKASERTLVDLKTHAGLKIGLAEGERVLTIETLDGPATRVGGEVPTGVDQRTTTPSEKGVPTAETLQQGAETRGPNTDGAVAPAQAANGPASPAKQQPAPSPAPPKP